eukprot:gene24481-38378_t
MMDEGGEKTARSAVAWASGGDGVRWMRCAGHERTR